MQLGIIYIYIYWILSTSLFILVIIQLYKIKTSLHIGITHQPIHGEDELKEGTTASDILKSMMLVFKQQVKHGGDHPELFTKAGHCSFHKRKWSTPYHHPRKYIYIYLYFLCQLVLLDLYFSEYLVTTASQYSDLFILKIYHPSFSVFVVIWLLREGDILLNKLQLLVFRYVRE